MYSKFGSSEGKPGDWIVANGVGLEGPPEQAAIMEKTASAAAAIRTYLNLNKTAIFIHFNAEPVRTGPMRVPTLKTI